MKKEVRELIGLLVEQGFDVKVTRKGHFIVRKNGQFVTTLAGTPSEYRGSKNALSDLRRSGFKPKRR